MSTPEQSVVQWSDPDRISSPPVAWAVDLLTRTLADRRAGATAVALCAPGDPLHDQVVGRAQAPDALPAESFAIARVNGDSTLAVAAGDDRGMVYALLELADVVRTAPEAAAALAAVADRFEQPHVGLRSLSRMFASHRLDTGWLHDRAFWDDYLTELATHRFNRFTLGFGLGYDYLIDKRVVDNYLCFLYPFVLDVPGYDVEVAHLSDDERRQNLESLRYVARAATSRGLEFGLGLWNHAYRLDLVSPTEHWLVSGLDADTHAPYCADALALLLTELPEVSTLTFRVHFEGGVPEPTHGFWRQVMTGLSRVERTIALDAHAKGINDDLLEALRSAGSPLTLSTKYWGEHMGLPYHQAAIRDKELVGHRQAVSQDEQEPGGEAGGRSGSQVTHRRSFTRYGYADYARSDADFALVHRIWPGTQRVLTLGDPATAAGIGRNATFAGASGVEWFDTLTFLGKKNSAEHPLSGTAPVQRELYADPELSLPGSATWQKYRVTLRLHGRLSYDPDASPQAWRRYLEHTVGPAAADCEAALAHATRVLPLITTAYAPSVAGNVFWPEMDTPVPLVEPEPVTDNPFAANGWHLNGDFDMTPPYTFGNTSPLDPELFARPDEYADSLLTDEPTAKYAAPDVADWLDALAAATLHHTAAARATGASTPEGSVELRRLVADALIAAHLGRSFAARLRAAAEWRLHHTTGSRDRLEAAIGHYRAARDAWAAAADAAAVYVDDVPFGQMPYQRGHWRDRLPAMDADLAVVAGHADTCTCAPSDTAVADRTRLTDQVGHIPPDRFEPGRPLPLTARVADPMVSVRLRYRTVDQSRTWSSVEMTGSGEDRIASIPAELTTGPYSLQYYFELRRGPDSRLWPGLDPLTLANQPYYVVHADPTTTWGR